MNKEHMQGFNTSIMEKHLPSHSQCWTLIQHQPMNLTTCFSSTASRSKHRDSQRPQVKTGEGPNVLFAQNICSLISEVWANNRKLYSEMICYSIWPENTMRVTATNYIQIQLVLKMWLSLQQVNVSWLLIWSQQHCTFKKKLTHSSRMLHCVTWITQEIFAYLLPCWSWLNSIMCPAMSLSCRLG